MKKIRQFLKPLYDIIPFKNKIYAFLRAIGFNPGHYAPFFYFTGVFDFKVSDKKVKMFNPGYQSHIENELFWRGIENGWEKTSTSIWLKLSEKSNVVMDIGANTGIFTMLTKSINENARVLSFEPIEFIAEKFKQNMELNNFSYELYDFALSNQEGEVVVFSESLVNSYTISLDQKNKKQTAQKFHEIKIKTVRLDEFITENNIDKIDLIKIDVERHEPMVLEGMGKYIKIMQPSFLIETQTDEIGKQIEELLKDIDYLYFNIDENGNIERTKNIGKSKYLNYLICSKENAEYLGIL